MPKCSRLTHSVVPWLHASQLGSVFRTELGEEFWKHYGAISRWWKFRSFPLTLPLPKFRRRDKAKIEIRKVFHTLIAKHRRDPQNYDRLESATLF